MSSVFDMIKAGLEEAIAYEKGECKANTTKMSVTDVEKFTAAEIKEIRRSTGLTQKAFAGYIGVSVKTVEAWEGGRNHPDGAASRMLWLTKNNPEFPVLSGIVIKA